MALKGSFQTKMSLHDGLKGGFQPRRSLHNGLKGGFQPKRSLHDGLKGSFNPKGAYTIALKGRFQHKQEMRRNQDRGSEDALKQRMLCVRCLWMLPLHLSPVWPFWILISKPKLPPSSS